MVDKSATAKLKARLKKHKYIICYKILQLCGRTLCSPFHDYYQWQIGQNKSTSKLYYSKNRKNDTEINRGIHVYIKKPDNTYLHSNEQVVPVQCFEKDFIAADNYYGEAVFRSAYLSQQAYNKATKINTEVKQEG